MEQRLIAVVLLSYLIPQGFVNGKLDTNLVKGGSRFPEVPGFKWVPQLDGTMKLMSDTEIKQELDESEVSQFYNPVRDVKFTLYVKGDAARLIPFQIRCSHDAVDTWMEWTWRRLFVF